VTFGVEADPTRAAWWLETLHLDDLVDRYPEQLSGGQRQRVSLARALAPGPDLVLLDEPFSALDAPVRDELRRELRSLQRKAGLSTVLVTHDPEEAAILADEILVLSDGRVLQTGRVTDVYRRPASLHVAQLLGIRNLGRGVIAADGTVLSGSVSLAVTERLPTGTDVFWTVPRERVRVTRFQADLAGSHPSVARPSVPEQTRAHRAVVGDVIDLGSTVEITVRLEGGLELTSRSTDPIVARPGEECLVHLEPETVTVWPAAATQSGTPPTT
jgi:molybdate transport system permease protein